MSDPNPDDWRPERNSLVEERLLNEARVEIRQLKAEIERLKSLLGPLRMDTLR